MTLEAPTLTGPQKPGKVQAIAILTLASGITNILWMLFLGVFIFSAIAIVTIGIGCLLYPLLLLPIILGVFEIIYAAKLLPTPIKPVKPSQPIAILEIVCMLTGNIIPLTAGIVALILYGDPEVKAYFEQHAPLPAAVPPAPEPEPFKAEPAVAPVLPKPESPVKVADTIVPASVEPAATMIAMQPVPPPVVEPEQPKAVTPAANQAVPVKAPAKAKPAAKKPAAAAPKAKTGKPATGPKAKAVPSKTGAKPARPKSTKKPTS